MVFPFFMASLAFVRKARARPRARCSRAVRGLVQAMKFIFTEEELSQLDGLPGEEEEPEAM